jgi:MoaA/NifB/PqqE/SkfB family radical SAM enzyme
MMLCMALTNRCTLACAGCLNNSGPTGEYGLSVKVLRGVLGWLAEQEAPQVDFSGGEPFVRRDVRDLIRLAKHLGIQVNVCTNGCIVDDEIVDLLADIRRVTITFYGCEEFHDRTTRTTGSYKKAIRTIAMLRGARTRLRANVVVLAPAVGDLPSLADALQEAGVHEIKFSLALPAGRGATLIPQLVSQEKSATLVRSIRSRGNLHVPVTIQDFQPCTFTCEISARGSLFLTHDGHIYPCPLFRHLDFAIGRITKAQPAYTTLEELDWSRALAYVALAGEGCCPAINLGLFKHIPGVVVHQGCPPKVERI